jgi:hypothetical protein
MRGKFDKAEETTMRKLTQEKSGLGSSIDSVAPRLVRLAALAVLLLFALSATSSAGVTGDPSEFALCPTSFQKPASATFLLCSHSETTGGQIAIGNSIVPINNNPDTVDFGSYSASHFGFLGPEVLVTPTNGQAFGGPAQVVPGGLLGLTGTLAPLSKPLDPINQVTSSIELAGPITPATVVDPTATKAFFCATGSINSCFGAPSPSSVLRVPIKVHLHNLLLGPNCYIGSNANPIVLNLQETPTSQPQQTGAGNATIVSGVEVADDTFAVPGATGCGLLGTLNLAVNLKVGLPSRSGKNAALIDEDGEIEPAALVCQDRGETYPCQ